KKWQQGKSPLPLFQTPCLGVVEPIASAESVPAFTRRGVKRLHVHSMRLRPEDKNNSFLLFKFYPMVTNTANPRSPSSPYICFPAPLYHIGLKTCHTERKTSQRGVTGDD